MKNEALKQAIEIAGSQSELARRLGTYPQLVQGWVSSSRPVPARWAKHIEKVTGVRKEELRPDIFD